MSNSLQVDGGGDLIFSRKKHTIEIKGQKLANLSLSDKRSEKTTLNWMQIDSFHSSILSVRLLTWKIEASQLQSLGQSDYKDD